MTWVNELSEALPVARREAVLPEATKVAAEIARRLVARRRVDRHRDEVESELVFQLHGTGVPEELAASGSVARLKRWMATVGNNHLNALYRQERREWSLRQAGPEPEVPAPVEGAALQLDGVLSFAGVEEGEERGARDAEAEADDEAGQRARLEPVLELGRRGLARQAQAARARGRESRAVLLESSFEEVLALYFGQATKSGLLEAQQLTRAALDQRHKRAREAALEGLELLLEERKITQLQATRGRALLRALVLVQR